MFAVSMALIVVGLAVSCSSRGKYSDVRKTMTEMNSAMAEFNTAAEKVANAKDAAAALDKMAAAYEKLAPEINKLQAKYPELTSTTPPEELKDIQAESATIGTKMGKNMMNIMMKYSEDPAVKKASDRLSVALMSMSTK